MTVPKGVTDLKNLGKKANETFKISIISVCRLFKSVVALLLELYFKNIVNK